MRRTLYSLVLFAFLALPGQAGAASSGNAAKAVKEPSEAPQAADDLEAYLQVAATNNQQLLAAFERWKAAAEAVNKSGYLPEPMLSMSYYLAPVQTRAGDQRFAIGLAQSFPWFGTLSLQEQQAALEADARKALLDDVALQVFDDVKQAYYEFAYLGQAIQLTKEVLELLRYLEAVTQTRYEAGLAEYDALIRLQVEVATIDNRLQSLQALTPALVTTMNAAMHRPVETDIPWPQALRESALGMEDETVLARLRTTSPQLAASRLRIQKAEAGIQLARTQYYPRFTLSLSTIVTDVARLKRAQSVNGNTVNFPASRTTEDAGVDPVVAGLQLSLPLWHGKYAAEEREAKAEKRAATADGAALLDTLKSQARLVLVQFRDAERQGALYAESLIPKATQALEATVEAYQADVASVGDLLEAERTLLELQLAHARALADQGQRLAQLERLLGAPLPVSTSAHPQRPVTPSLTYQLDAPAPRVAAPPPS